MTEYATKKPNREETENKENICSICGKAGAERRILPSAQAIEYAVKGKKDTRGAVLVCDECFSKETRTHFACEVLKDGSVVEYR